VKRILIFGASGEIGTALTKELLENGQYDVYGTCRQNPCGLLPKEKTFQIEVSEIERVEEVLQQVKPEIVVMALRGDFMEQHAFHEEAANWVKANGGRLYFCSTANVFDGETDRPHYEDEPPVPASDYGYFKTGCEVNLIEILYEQLTILRIPQIWGKDSRRIRELRQQIEKGETIQVRFNLFLNRNTDEMLAKQIVYLIEKEIPGIFHLGTQDVMSEAEFVTEIGVRMGWKPKLEKVFLEKEMYLAVLRRKEIFPPELQVTHEQILEAITEV
jgi:dTDP-4-dehydrorhamnose reductase